MRTHLILVPVQVAVASAQSPEACPTLVAEAKREEALRLYQAGTTSVLAEQWEEALPALEQAARLDPQMVRFGRARPSAETRRRRLEAKPAPE